MRSAQSALKNRNSPVTREKENERQCEVMMNMRWLEELQKRTENLGMKSDPELFSSLDTDGKDS